MLNPQRPLNWRRKWLRWRRLLQRYHISLLAIAILLALVIMTIIYRWLLSNAELNESFAIPVQPAVAPRLTTHTERQFIVEDPKPVITEKQRELAPSPAIAAPIEIPRTEWFAPSPAASLSVEGKRNAVRNAVLHAWSGYKKDAFGHDELLPLSHSFGDNWGSLAWTLIDSIGTLFMCGLVDEYNIARDFIASMRFDQINSDVSVFETNIRILGGLLSAFELSGDYMFIQQARSVGDALMPAFSTASGMPTSRINLATGRQSGSWLGPDTAILSEFGSLQVEFASLSHTTGDPKFMTAAMKVYEILSKNTDGGLLPTEFNVISGRPSNNLLTLGSLSDSYYEYLLKLYIMSDRTIPAALDMYIKAVDEIMEKLIVEWEEPETQKKRARIVQLTNGVMEHKMEHLTCFIPGMLALGAYYGELHGVENLLKRKDRHMDVARKLLDTCVSMYTMTATQLPPELIQFTENEARIGGDPRYLLRPETVESLFILYRITKNEAYRDAGWNIFSAIEKHCKTDTAYAAVSNVDSTKDPAPKLDNMESFVMAETFKYLYLLFSPETFFPLDHFVFTTEAHPLRIMKGSKIMMPVSPFTAAA